MAVIHDVMPAFELFQPTSVDDALALLAQYGANAWVLAGGLDSFDWFKDRIKRPKVVVDLSQVKELRGVRESGDGLEIGAMTTLTEVVRHPVIREKFGILPDAAEAAASPQIRNQGTIGGNVSQEPVAGITAAAGRAIAPAATFATPIRHGPEPRARHPRRRPLRCRESVGHRAGADRARRENGDSNAARASE